MVVTDPGESGSVVAMSAEEQQEIMGLINTNLVIAPRMHTAVGCLIMAQVEEERRVWGTTGLGRESP